MTEKAKDVATDFTATPEERAEAITRARMANAKQSHNASKRIDLFDEGKSIYKQADQLVPSLHELYADAPHMVAEYQTKAGDDIDHIDYSPEAKSYKRKTYNEPEDLYSQELPDKAYRFVTMYFRERFPTGGFSSHRRRGLTVTEGDWLAEEIQELARGRGLRPVSMVRQRVWFMIAIDRVIRASELVSAAIPQDRTPEEDNPMTLDNQRLHLLLGGSCFEELDRLARSVDATNKMALVYILKVGIDTGIL